MSTASRDLASLRVLIVGCGNIAGGFDQGRVAGHLPSTHAGAYMRDGRFDLLACVEPDDKRRGEFMAAWGVATGFQTIEEALASGKQFDVISICSPTECHAHDLEMALSLQPKLIFCEKPLTTSVTENQRLLEECAQLNIRLAINYTRRWDAEISTLHANMQAGRWGQLRSVMGYYNKGVLNNGSHMVDLLHLLVGAMEIVKVGKPIHDFFANDPTVPVWLEGASGIPVMLACGHAEDYAIFELQLVFSVGMVIMEEGGLFWRERAVLDSGTFKGYRVLDAGVRRVGQYPGAMLNAADNIYRAIQQGDLLASSGESALAAQDMCEKIKQQAYNVKE
ncbi:MAG: Gfo/Idh/MocA family oxidoreductase [Methylobacter sp.]|nr:Gfo/Idh/MocA family oxidoreductase [Methylobacter sp.]MDP2097064.1 Gfo/Idh/MocA family oxidoreductase [Methylobacter sp.]MDP2428002.1 Gfo/Idh/MocA family oxidoreductase [Methylobacter sp.]MDP3055898.1 Gfo/Idh/MocA family oxidoreductase [Methylobacter sp.]MDP3363056.1 Gfo/Idh/MocA family oxidoreductase [Methylobacter sp.]